MSESLRQKDPSCYVFTCSPTVMEERLTASLSPPQASAGLEWIDKLEELNVEPTVQLECDRVATPGVGFNVATFMVRP